jgi:hypothetical protein
LAISIELLHTLIIAVHDWDVALSRLPAENVPKASLTGPRRASCQVASYGELAPECHFRDLLVTDRPCSYAQAKETQKANISSLLQNQISKLQAEARAGEVDHEAYKTELDLERDRLSKKRKSSSSKSVDPEKAAKYASSGLNPSVLSMMIENSDEDDSRSASSESSSSTVSSSSQDRKRSKKEKKKRKHKKKESKSSDSKKRKKDKHTSSKGSRTRDEGSDDRNSKKRRRREEGTTSSSEDERKR